MGKFTNILDGSASGDYYHLDDIKRDHLYMQGKVVESIKVANQLYEDYYIIDGCEISDDGAGKVAISEGGVLGKDGDGFSHIISFPGVSGITLPSGWDDNRQIWATLEYYAKETTDQRAHKSTGLDYNYIVEDSYSGIINSDHLFVDSDPNLTSETVVCLGSFKMNGTSYSKVPGHRTRIMQDNSYKPTSAQPIGNALTITGLTGGDIAAFDNKNIAFADAYFDEIRCYTWDGTDYAETGAGYSIADILNPSLDAMTATDIAYVDENENLLACYRWNGSVYSLVGNRFNFSGTNGRIAAITTNTIAMLINNTHLATYNFGGTNWTKVGNSFSTGTLTYPSITAMSRKDIAFVDASLKVLRYMTWDGTDWSQVGAGLTISGIGNPAICSFNPTDIYIIDSTTEILHVYRWKEEVWTLIDEGVKITGVGNSNIAAFNATDFTIIDSDRDKVECYRLGYSITQPPFRAWE